jgi:hypothetical protein
LSGLIPSSQTTISLNDQCLYCLSDQALVVEMPIESLKLFRMSMAFSGTLTWRLNRRESLLGAQTMP